MKPRVIASLATPAIILEPQQPAKLSPAVTCAVCRRNAASRGAACESCLAALAGPVEIAPQQLESRAPDATPAALIDVFGHPHHLVPATQVGRAADRDLVIVEPSVSRTHAELVQDGDAWQVRDHGSTCGTFVNDRPVGEGAVLHDGDRVRFGDIAFYFVTGAARLPPPPMVTDPGTVRLPPRPTRRQLPAVPIQLGAPSGGGGGFVVIAGKLVQLTTAQYELIERLVDRMRRDADKPDAVRGFVPAGELVTLSLDSSDPGEDHVRQLVRRVRRALIKAEIGDVIEARRGLGYRLKLVPT